MTGAVLLVGFIAVATWLGGRRTAALSRKSDCAGVLPRKCDEAIICAETDPKVIWGLTKAENSPEEGMASEAVAVARVLVGARPHADTTLRLDAPVDGWREPVQRASEEVGQWLDALGKTTVVGLPVPPHDIVELRARKSLTWRAAWLLGAALARSRVLESADEIGWYAPADLATGLASWVSLLDEYQEFDRGTHRCVFVIDGGQFDAEAAMPRKGDEKLLDVVGGTSNPPDAAWKGNSGHPVRAPALAAAWQRRTQSLDRSTRSRPLFLPIFEVLRSHQSKTLKNLHPRILVGARPDAGTTLRLDAPDGGWPEHVRNREFEAGRAYEIGGKMMEVEWRGKHRDVLTFRARGQTRLLVFDDHVEIVVGARALDTLGGIVGWAREWLSWASAWLLVTSLRRKRPLDHADELGWYVTKVDLAADFASWGLLDEHSDRDRWTQRTLPKTTSAGRGRLHSIMLGEKCSHPLSIYGYAKSLWAETKGRGAAWLERMRQAGRLPGELVWRWELRLRRDALLLLKRGGADIVADFRRCATLADQTAIARAWAHAFGNAQSGRPKGHYRLTIPAVRYGKDDRGLPLTRIRSVDPVWRLVQEAGGQAPVEGLKLGRERQKAGRDEWQRKAEAVALRGLAALVAPDHRDDAITAGHAAVRCAQELVSSQRWTAAYELQVAATHDLHDGELDPHAELDACCESGKVTTKPGSDVRGDDTPAPRLSSIEDCAEPIETMLEFGAGPTAIYNRLDLDESFEDSLGAVKRQCLRLRKAKGVAADVAMPVGTAAGEVAQVDFGYVGQLYDPDEGRLRKAWIFMMVLACSRVMVARITFDQKIETWLRCHVEAFVELGGVPKVIVPSNLETAAIRKIFAVDGSTVLNRSYGEFAGFHGFRMDPTPVRAPEKKGKAESAVKSIRNDFFATRKDQLDVVELRTELRTWLDQIAKVRLHGTTQRHTAERFEIERTHLLPLPSQRWEPVLWREVQVRDTHVQVARATYSVPWRLVGKPVLVRLTKHSVEIYWEDVCVATHERQPPGKRSTIEAHLPEHRQDLCHRSRDFWEQRADALGEGVVAYIREVFDADDVLSQLRTVRAIVTHLETFPLERAQAACRRARFCGLHNYGAIKDILRKGLDLEPLPLVVERQSGVLDTPRFARDSGKLLQLPLEETGASD